MLRGLLIMLQRISAQRISHDQAPSSVYGMTHATEDTPHEHSPAALAARLDAVERQIEERQALHQMQMASTISHLGTKEG